MNDDLEKRPAGMKAITDTFMRKPWLFPLAGLAVSTLCVCLIVGGALLASNRSQLGEPTRQLASLPATPTPTPPCVEPSLTLGAFRFRIGTIQRGLDGSLPVPPDTPGVAYWVEGTTPNYVFALSPLVEYAALPSAIHEGDPAVVQWADCGLEEFVVLVAESRDPDLELVFDQSKGGITTFAMGEAGVFIRGGHPEPVREELPSPEVEGFQMEIDFLDTTTSEDGKTITTGITIHNTGTQPIPLKPSDFSLMEEGGQPQAPVEVEPALPAEIPAGGEGTFYITFLKPLTSPAVFRVLDFTVDLYH